jgi:hypothetical protein
MENFDKVYKPQNWKKKKEKEKRKNNGTEVYMCALYRNYQKTCCETKCDLRTNEFKQSYWSKA